MATSTTTTTSAPILDVANKMVQMQFGPKSVFANELIRTGRSHANGRDAVAGDPVKFFNYSRLNPSTATLGEAASGTASTVEMTAASVALLEKGNFVTTTEKLRSLSFEGLSQVASLVAANAAESTDQYAMEVAETQTGSDYVTFVGQSAKSAITGSNVLTADIVRQTFNKLERNNVPRVNMNGEEMYLWVIHPDAFYDLKKETGDAAFRKSYLEGNPEGIIRGEYGAFEGFRFIVSTGVKTDYIGGEEKQAATTVAGAEAVGATVIGMTSGTGMDAGNVININDGTDDYAYTVVSRSTNDVTIGKCIRKNGFAFYAADGSGLVTALSGGEAAEESSVVYSNYALGADAFGYAYAVQPEIRTSADPTDAYGRLERVAWYALHGIGEIRPESLHKVYASSSINPNS